MGSITLTPSAELLELAQTCFDERAARSGRVSTETRHQMRQNLTLDGAKFVITNPRRFVSNGEEVMYVSLQYNGLNSGHAGFPLPAGLVRKHSASASSH